jgi:pimeloyl-ACP methyl ester carboxylesterase
VLVVIAERDTLVPPAHSERLAGAWRGPVQVVRLPRAAHGDLHAHPEYWSGIAMFLRAPGR